jgi:hypothetical protein
MKAGELGDFREIEEIGSNSRSDAQAATIGARHF